MMKRTFNIGVLFFLLIALASPFSAKAQIIDDSTQTVYGAYTTYYTNFERIKNNNYLVIKVDTLIDGLHNFDFVSASGFKYQNLGVVGTSTKPIYYEPTRQIGARSGFDSYAPYYFSKEDITFFDTKSPYTFIDATFGGGRRSITTVKHARNITPYWNAGIHFRRMSIEKQVSSSGRNDRQVVSTAYYLHSHYMAPSGKYVVMGALSRLNHEVKENGGIDTTGFLTNGEFFDEDAPVNLENAKSADLNLNFFLYNEFKWKRQLNFYYQWEQIGNKYRFEDLDLSDESGFTQDGKFLQPVFINPDSTTDRALFTQSIHEPGIKGSQGNFYYNFHLKLRKAKYVHTYLPNNTDRWETYGGFNFRFDFDSLKDHSLNAQGEYLVGGGYYLRGDYVNKYFKATYQKTRYQPTIIQDTYFGNHNEWYNNFDPINSDYLSGEIDIHLRILDLVPKLTLINLNHNVYYNEESIPEQAGGNVQLIHPSLEFGLHLFNRSIHFENEVIYTLKSGDDKAVNAIRIPNLFLNSRLYFGKEVFNQTINIQAGLQANYKSSYFAERYNPALRQFYLQSDFEVPAALVIDAFLDFRIDTFAAFIRYEHLNQQTNQGYFTFPNYVGQKKVLSLGITWMFFD